MDNRIIVFVSGAIIMGLEIVASRLLAPYFGSSLYVWGSLIGVVLSVLAIGYWLGGKLADKVASKKILANILFVAGILIVLIPFLSGKILPILKNLGPVFGPLISSIILLGLPGILLGMVTPYALKLSAKKLKEIGSTAGNLYSIATIGSIVGTFLTSFFLIPFTGVTNIIFFMGVILVILSLFILKKRYLFIVLVLLIFLVPGYWLKVNFAFYKVVDDLSYKTIYETDSAYYHIIVADDRATGNERMLFLDDIRQSSMYLNHPNDTSFKYPYYFHAAFNFNPDINSALFVGGGAMSAPKDFLEEYPNIEIDVVEIDPEVVEIAYEYFEVPMNNERLNVHVGDARVFLENTNETYDLIVLDAYSGTYVPFHLMTQEFFSLVRSRLNDNGVVAYNMITPLKGDLAELFRAEYKTMDVVFDNVYVVPVTVRGSYIPGNVIIFASENEPLTRGEYLENLYTGEINTANVRLLTDDYAPVNVINPLLGKEFN